MAFVQRLALFAGVLFCTLAVAMPGAIAQSISSGDPIQEIRIEGNQRIEPETVRSYMQINPGDPFDARRIDQALKNLFGTGLFADVNFRRDGDALVVQVTENPIINKLAFEGNERLEDEALQAGSPAAAARRLHPGPRPGRREAHPRPLSPQRPLRRHGRSEDHQAGPEPREPGVRDQRRRRHRSAPHRFRRQQGVQRQRPPGRDRDPGSGLLPVPQHHRHLRSGPPDAGQGSAAQVLSVRRLCRFPRGLGGRRAVARPGSVLHHLHGRGGRALHARHRRHQDDAEGPRSRIAARRRADRRRRLVQRRPGRRDRAGDQPTTSAASATPSSTCGRASTATPRTRSST